MNFRFPFRVFAVLLAVTVSLFSIFANYMKVRAADIAMGFDISVDIGLAFSTFLTLHGIKISDTAFSAVDPLEDLEDYGEAQTSELIKFVLLKGSYDDDNNNGDPDVHEAFVALLERSEFNDMSVDEVKDAIFSFGQEVNQDVVNVIEWLKQLGNGIVDYYSDGWVFVKEYIDKLAEESIEDEIALESGEKATSFRPAVVGNRHTIAYYHTRDLFSFSSNYFSGLDSSLNLNEIVPVAFVRYNGLNLFFYFPISKYYYSLRNFDKVGIVFDGSNYVWNYYCYRNNTNPYLSYGCYVYCDVPDLFPEVSPWFHVSGLNDIYYAQFKIDILDGASIIVFNSDLLGYDQSGYSNFSDIEKVNVFLDKVSALDFSLFDWSKLVFFGDGSLSNIALKSLVGLEEDGKVVLNFAKDFGHDQQVESDGTLSEAGKEDLADLIASANIYSDNLPLLAESLDVQIVDLSNDAVLDGDSFWVVPDPSPTPDPDPTPGPDPTPDPDPTPGPDPTPDPDPGGDEDGIEQYKISDLRKVFPFCLPFDLIDFFNLFSAEPEAPKFKWNVPTLKSVSGGTADNEVLVDFSVFNQAARVMRTLEAVGFIVLLIFITRSRMIRG